MSDNTPEAPRNDNELLEMLDEAASDAMLDKLVADEAARLRATLEAWGVNLADERYNAELVEIELEHLAVQVLIARDAQKNGDVDINTQSEIKKGIQAMLLAKGYPRSWKLLAELLLPGVGLSESEEIEYAAHAMAEQASMAGDLNATRVEMELFLASRGEEVTPAAEGVLIKLALAKQLRTMDDQPDFTGIEKLRAHLRAGGFTSPAWEELLMSIYSEEA